jgi:hypothetical protein
MNKSIFHHEPNKDVRENLSKSVGPEQFESDNWLDLHSK